MKYGQEFEHETLCISTRYAANAKLCKVFHLFDGYGWNLKSVMYAAVRLAADTR